MRLHQELFTAGAVDLRSWRWFYKPDWREVVAMTAPTPLPDDQLRIVSITFTPEYIEPSEDEVLEVVPVPVVVVETRGQ